MNLPDDTTHAHHHFWIDDTAWEQQCECVNQNHVGGRCVNIAHAHHFCGPCQSEGAVVETPLQQLGRLLADANAVPVLSMTADQWREVLAHHTAELTARAERAEQELRDTANVPCACRMWNENGEAAT